MHLTSVNRQLAIYENLINIGSVGSKVLTPGYACGLEKTCTNASHDR